MQTVFYMRKRPALSLSLSLCSVMCRSSATNQQPGETDSHDPPRLPCECESRMRFVTANILNGQTARANASHVPMHFDAATVWQSDDIADDLPGCTIIIPREQWKREIFHNPASALSFGRLQYDHHESQCGSAGTSDAQKVAASRSSHVRLSRC